MKKSANIPNITDIKIFRADISPFYDDSFRQKYIPYLTDFRKKRVENAKSRDFAASSTAAGILQRHVLSLYGVNTYALREKEDEKPYIFGNPLYFSISHTENFVFLAVYGKNIGIDAEKYPAFENGGDTGKYLTLAKRFFTKSESEFLIKSKSPGFDFIKIWGLKEAYAKYCGKKLSETISDISFVKDDAIISAIPGKNLVLSGFSLNENHHIAICSDKKATEKQIETINFQEELLCLK